MPDKSLKIAKELLKRADISVTRGENDMPFYMSSFIARRYIFLYILMLKHNAGERAWSIDVLSAMGFAVDTIQERNRALTYIRRMCASLEADFDVSVSLCKASSDEASRGRYSYYEIKSWGFLNPGKFLPFLIRNAAVFENLIKNNIYGRDE